jgi:phosphoserine aminotransferase
VTEARRPWNFSAGPAMLPEPVLREVAAEMLDWHGSGLGVMEMSHRGREFGEILAGAEADLRTLLAIPAHFRVLFMQGGGLAENAIVPMNLIGRRATRTADLVVTGAWSEKSAQEAMRYGTVHVAASTRDGGYRTLPEPSTWRLSDAPSYVHVCSNETIHGVEFADWPDLAALGCDAPLVVDCSSHVASRPMDWSRIGLAFAGAQKNIGPAGLTLVIVREDLLGDALPVCPSAFDYQRVAEAGSMYNTPPTFAIYVAGLVFRWLMSQTHAGLTGLAAIEARNREKAALLYGAIDRSGFYRNPVEPAARSRMNVPFFLADPSREADFLAGARERGLLQLKGHKTVGGLRASIYNAMPLAGVRALVDWMHEFETRHA